MSLSIPDFTSRFNNFFSAYEQVEEEIVRCVRSLQDRIYAVYYIDLSQRLPNTIDELDAYQDRIVANRYFEGPKSLQWSNYLYFVYDNEIPSDTKRMVERDRKFARKFVVDEKELESALTPPRFQVAEGVIDASVLNTWTKLLAEANLDNAVLNDESLPKKIKLIEANFGQSSLATPKVNPVPHAPPVPFLKSLELKEYRQCPKKRQFEFGTVTLITGVNGSGKTSLLEAIELLYCGKNKRDPNDSSAFAIKGTFKDGSSQSATHKQATNKFRERSLAWYGQAEVRRNVLYQSFAQYNFLNADAAVGLAESKNDFEEDLSKLLVGPEASKTWKDIERISKELDKTLKELLGTEGQAKRELEAINEQILEAEQVPKESDAVYKTLSKALKDASWDLPEIEGQIDLHFLVDSAASYEAVLEEAAALSWPKAPTTLAALREFVAQLEKVLDGAEKLEEQIVQVEESKQKAIQRLTEATGKQTLVRELESYLKQGFASRADLLETKSAVQARSNIVLAGWGEVKTWVERAAETQSTVSEFIAQVAAELDARKSEYREAAKSLDDFSKLSSRAKQLSEQLRNIADQILKTAENRDVCPLCHTSFKPGDLSTRILEGVDLDLEKEAQERLRAVTRSKEKLAEAEAKASAGNWLERACVSLNFGSDSQVKLLWDELLELEATKKGLSDEISLIQAEFQTLEENGLTKTRFEFLMGSLFPAKEAARIELGQLSSVSERLANEIRELEASLSKSKAEATALWAKVGERFGAVQTTSEHLAIELRQRRERLARSRSILREIDASYPWPETRQFSDVLVNLGVIRKLTTDFQATSTNEQQAVTVLRKSKERKAKISEQLAGLEPRIKRFTEARTVIEDIVRDHSLSAAMEEALHQNKAAIESIFARIHSPAEFSGLIDMTTLSRKDGGTATLHQVSTGQRAAYALSLFLAQNAQLRSAPPMIIVDDPIAHVDDLNCLSFLDYLREVVISGERQVVFATANEKLAALFERKFDFLGTREFVAIKLQR